MKIESKSESSDSEKALLKLALSPSHWPDTMTGELHKNTPSCYLYIWVFLHLYKICFRSLFWFHFTSLWFDQPESPTETHFHRRIRYVFVLVYSEISWACFTIWPVRPSDKKLSKLELNEFRTTVYFYFCASVFAYSYISRACFILWPTRQSVGQKASK